MTTAHDLCNDTSKRSWVTTSDGWRMRLGKAVPRR